MNSVILIRWFAVKLLRILFDQISGHGIHMSALVGSCDLRPMPSARSNYFIMTCWYPSMPVVQSNYEEVPPWTWTRHHLHSDIDPLSSQHFKVQLSRFEVYSRRSE